MIFRKSKGLVGLDIGSSAVKLVELKAQPKGDNKWKLLNLGVVPLSPEVIVDGSIMDSTMVVDAIAQLFNENKIKSSDVAIAVSGHSVIIKKITMAYMAEEELSESIRWEAESYIPFDIDDVNLDYHVWDDEDRGDGNMDVLLVAAKKEKVSEYVSVVQQSSKSPSIVDVDSLALQNALTANYELSDFQVTAVINIGASVMNINIMQGPTSVFWRDISFGGNIYTDAIQKDLGVDFETAEQLKRGESVEDYDFERVIPILSSVTNDLGVEVQKTFDFFKATTSADKINRIMLSGGCSKILNLDTYLSERFEAPVEILNPFQNISYNEKQFHPDLIHELKASAAIAVGLAMRRGGDKRINLIEEKKAAAPKAVKKASTQTNEIQENILLIVMVLLAGLTFFILNKRTKDEYALVKAEETKLKKEHEKLKPWEEKQKDYEIQKELLNEKIQKISALKDTRQGPVKLMEDVANVLPDSVWLESITQGYDRKLTVVNKEGISYEPSSGKVLSSPDMVRITGKAKTTEAITNFAEKFIKMDKRYAETELNNLDEDSKDGPREYVFELYFKVLREAAVGGGGEGQP